MPSEAKLFLAALALLAASASAQAQPLGEPGRDGSKRNPLKNVYLHSGRGQHAP